MNNTSDSSQKKDITNYDSEIISVLKIQENDLKPMIRKGFQRNKRVLPSVQKLGNTTLNKEYTI